MNNIMLSVIVPIYNMSKYLDRCINSLINQNYKKMEIILIDDGSTDNSMEICKYYAEKYTNIRIYSKENTGLGATRNYGIPLAKGEYVGFVDSDDYIDCNMYEHLMNITKNNNCDIGVCGYEEIYSDTKISTYSDVKPDFIIEDDKIEIIKKYLLLKIPTFAWNKIYKRDFLLEFGVKFSEGCYYEDINMVAKALHYCNKVAITENKYYKYFQRNNSIMHTYTEKHLTDYIEQISEFYKFICTNYNINEILIELKSSKFRLTYNMLIMLKVLKKETEVIRCFEKISNPIIIFGASKAGEIIKYYCDIANADVMFFCDNDKGKRGQIMNGVTIVDVDKLVELKTNGYKFNILLASVYYNDIYNQLRKLKLDDLVVDINYFQN